jgi:glycosyltransferase involved in cell wall biosynthesis
VVAYRIGALAETIKDGVNGLLVEPRDYHGFAKAIQRLSDNPEEARAMGLAGQEKLKNLYSRTKWLDQIGLIYQKILNYPQ